MKRLTWFATMTVTLVCLAGCRTAETQTVKSGNAITPESLDRIVDRQWILREMTINGNDFDLASKQPFIKFSRDGKVSGFGSINRLSGSMQWNDQGKIQWSPLLSTRMAGPTELMNQESTFLETLPKVQRLSLEGINLLAQTEDSETELVFFVPEN
jgi:heat shock protein HslJ